MIHLATLVHDDVLDGAEKRRDQPTANSRWGNTISVLLGDCLFAHALDLATNFDDAEVSRAHRAGGVGGVHGRDFADAAAVRPEPEPAGLLPHHRDEDGGAVRGGGGLGARLNDVGPEVSEALKVYGLKIGTAYQVYDDLLDIAGDEAAAGKTLGTDLKKGKLTLPILNLLQASENGQRERLTQTILRGDDDDLAALREAAHAPGRWRRRRRPGAESRDEGLRQLDVLAASPYRDALADVGRRLGDDDRAVRGVRLLLRPEALLDGE